MKRPFKFRSTTPEEDAALTQGQFEDRFTHLIERFHLTGDVESLKEFILRGGDIHKYDLGKTIVDMLGKSPAPNPGGAQDAEMLNFYLDVEAARIAPALKNKNKRVKADFSLNERLAMLKKKTSKEDAIEKIAEANGLKYDGGRYRYKNGKMLFEELVKKG